MQIFGHRGSPGFPRHGENTSTSFRRALAEGADGVEFDVRRCGDGRLVVIHDPTLNRTTNGKGVVAKLPYSELSRFDAGHGESVPLLSSVLDQLAGRCRINIELKESNLADDVAALVADRSLHKDVVVSAFEPYWEDLGLLSAQDIPIGLLVASSELRRLGLDAVIEATRRLGAGSIHVPRQAADGDLVGIAHTAHLLVRVFTVNSTLQTLHLKRLGVDAIFSDYPGRCKLAIQRSGDPVK